MKARNRSRKNITQRLQTKGQENGQEHKDECCGSQSHSQIVDFKNVIFMRHGKIEFSYHSFKIFNRLHTFFSFFKFNLNIKKKYENTNVYIFLRKKIVELVRKTLYSIITSKSDYKDFNYRQFMTFLLNEVDPPLSKKGTEINMQNIPKEIDVIYCSSAKRSIQTAKLIQENLEKLGHGRPRIAYDLQEELAEVKFSGDILTLEEFNRYRGLAGCRTVILRKWYKGKNQAETFQYSIERAERLCQFLKENGDTNIILVTHGWYLRLLKMYFLGEKNSFKNLRSKDNNLNYGQSFRIQLSNSFQPHPSFPQRLAAETVSASVLEAEMDGTKTLEAVHHS